MSASDEFELEGEVLGALPVINHFLDRLGLEELLETYLPHDDRRLKLAPAKAIGVVVRNLVIGHEPVYALGEWATPFDPVLLGLAPGEVGLLNDDRVGRTLARLFDADRASLFTTLVLNVVDNFNVDVSQLHNDSTSVSLQGVYRTANGGARGNKTTPVIARGHSKDHRPDLKQLVWILTVTADGAIPVAHRVAAGNTEDSTTHIETWDHLAGLFATTDFCYVADSKLATRPNMDHIDGRGGRFISVLARTRREDKQFRDWVVDHEPDWTEARRRPARRRDDPDDVFDTTEAPWPSVEGYRVIWVRSSSKIDRDADSRTQRIAAGCAALDDLNERLASPRTRIKTPVAVQQAASAALGAASASRWITFNVEETTKENFRQESRGRPSNQTRYRRSVKTRHHLAYSVRDDLVAHDAASDGCFPLITNDTDRTDAEILAAYKHQPHLERRYSQLKGTQHIAPMFLKDPARIEGLFACHFIALLVGALIERQIRDAMDIAGITELSLYPEDRGCAAPSAARIIQIFHGLSRHHLTRDGQHVQTFEPELGTLQHQILDLLNIPPTTYHHTP